jgi:general secretion pathway protein I
MRRRGFTLVEVLVALVIVTIGMSAVLATLTSSADTASYLRDKTFAQWVAMNRIAEVRLQTQRLSTGKTSGDMELGGRRWRWEQEVTRLEIPGVQRIDVRVRDAAAPGSDKQGWLVTVSGISGDAVAPPGGTELVWERAPGGPGNPNPPAPGNDEPPPPAPAPKQPRNGDAPD